MVWKNDQVSERETEEILKVARGCLAVEGDFVELGCYKGDTSMLLAEVLRDFNTKLVNISVILVQKYVENFVKKLWIYDSFEGLPEKSVADESALGQDFKDGELLVTKREVKERFLRAELPVPVIKKAWFKDLDEADLPDKIAFAFLDGDFYESIKDSLKLIEGEIMQGGVILVHDYYNPALPGVMKAVDEWLEGKKYKSEQYESLIIIRQ